jgi:hypothetical protein
MPQLIHTFTIAFFAFHAIFEIVLMVLSNKTSGLAVDYEIPGLGLHTSYLVQTISSVVLYLLGVLGIVFILRSRKGGIYMLYSSVVLLIVTYLVKKEPDWYSALTLALIILFYAVFLHLIRSDSKLSTEQPPENQK